MDDTEHRTIAPIVGPDDPRHFTDSGIEIRPLYTDDDLPLRSCGTAGRARRLPVHAGRSRRHVPAAALDDAPVRRLRQRQGVQRALPLPAGARLHRPLDGVRSADAARARLRRSSLPRRGRPDRRRDRHDRRHADRVRRDPAGQGLDVDDDQRARRRAAAALRARRGGAGRRQRPAPRHHAERHPQGVHRARELHLPAGGRDPADDRPVLLLPRAASRSGTRSPSAATTSARRAARPFRRSGSRSPTGSPTCRRRSTPAWRSTSSARGSRSSSTATTTSSRRSRSSAPPGGCGRGSCASGSAPGTSAPGGCASTRRPAA